MDLLRICEIIAGIGPAHFLAETTRPLGRGCLQFSPFFYIPFFVSQMVMDTSQKAHYLHH